MRRSETPLGVFGFLAVTLVVLGALVVFARYPGIFRTGREFRTVFRSVAGLNPGDEVRYGGLLVGIVTNIDVAPRDPTKVLVQFRVRRTLPVRADTRASITQVGLLGQPYLQLEPGRRDSPLVADGGTIPSEDNPTFEDAMSRLAAFFDRADTVLSGAERFTHASPLDRLDQTLTRIDTLVAITTRGSNSTFTNLERTSQSLSELVERSDKLVATLDTAVREGGPGIRTTQQEALRTVRELNSVIGDFRDALQQEGGLDKLVRNMAVASENLARLSERLERDPSSVLKSRAAPVKLAGPKVHE